MKFSKILYVSAILLLFPLVFFSEAKAGRGYCYPQCLEYVQKRLPVGGPYGDANGFWRNPQRGYKRVSKGGKCKPKPGDVLYWNIGRYGHVAIIKKVKGNTVYVNDSNRNNRCKERKNAKVSLNESGVVGWLSKSPCIDGDGGGGGGGDNDYCKKYEKYKAKYEEASKKKAKYKKLYEETGDKKYKEKYKKYKKEKSKYKEKYKKYKKKCKK